MPRLLRLALAAALAVAVAAPAHLGATPAATAAATSTESADATAQESANGLTVTLSLRDYGAFATWTVPDSTGPYPTWRWWVEHNGVQVRTGSTRYAYSNLGGTGAAFVPGETYRVFVAEEIGWNNGPVTGPAGYADFVARGKAAAPASVHTVAGDRSATVTWTAPPPEQDVRVTMYLVEDRASGRFVHVGPEVRSYRFDSLDNGRTYTFEVTAENEYSWGETAVGNTVVPDVVPGRPRYVRAYARDNAAKVTWRAAAASGSPVTAYRVTAYPGGRTVKVAGDRRTARVTRLRQGRRYRFEVVAINRVGASAVGHSRNRVRPY